MNVFDEEILNVWRNLASAKVSYMMIGGNATNLHIFQRFIGGMDIWIKDSLDNRKNLRKAFQLSNLGDIPQLETIPFIAGWTDFHLNNGLRLDILTDMKGLEGYSFDECLAMASVADIEEVHVPFLHINQLIANKKAVNRPKDQIDVQALEEIIKLREE